MLISILLVSCLSFLINNYQRPKDTNINEKKIETLQSAPPCIQMYYYVSKYSTEYNIPKKYAFGIAYQESRYKGPDDWKYKHSLKSNAGAVGPMQIMPKYAHPFVDVDFTEEDLQTDIDMNVKASMRIMKMLYEKHKDWRLALGAYNTGHPCINDYAIKVINYNLTF